MKSTLLYDRVEGLDDFRDSAVLDQDARLQLIAHDDWGRRRDALLARASAERDRILPRAAAEALAGPQNHCAMRTRRW